MHNDNQESISFAVGFNQRFKGYFHNLPGL